MRSRLESLSDVLYVREGSERLAFSFCLAAKGLLYTPASLIINYQLMHRPRCRRTQSRNLQTPLRPRGFKSSHFCSLHTVSLKFWAYGLIFETNTVSEENHQLILKPRWSVTLFPNSSATILSLLRIFNMATMEFMGPA
jgi:hypothetical protein